jgi:dTDP-4-amino-4,6-dideoxygalactose transaminase
LSKSVVSLPMHPYLDEATQDRIVAAVLKSVG